jgi:hypothetical protein
VLDHRDHVQRHGDACYEPDLPVDYFSYYFTLVVTPLFLVSGIFFPVDDFPAPVPQIAWFTTLYHAVNVCRALAHRADDGGAVDVRGSSSSPRAGARAIQRSCAAPDRLISVW